jgi:predicted GNAT family N-acyltransferase
LRALPTRRGPLLFAESGVADIELHYVQVGDDKYLEAKEVRYQCLYGDWGLPRELVEDTDGRTYEHLIAEEDGRVVGYGRLHLEAGDSQIYQLCVVPERRGRGIAVVLMQELMRRAKRAGRYEVHLDAREHVIGFYEKLGFVGEGELFLSMRTHTPHLVMRRALDDV